MAYAPRKKKSLWDNIVDTVGGAVDRVVPGDQSNLRSATTRANNAQVSPVSRPQAQQQPIIEQNKPTLTSMFGTRKTIFGEEKPYMTFDKPDTPQASTVQRPLTNTQAVNERLDKGYSWEDIARDTKTDVAQIKDYSEKTRPGYGGRGLVGTVVEEIVRAPQTIGQGFAQISGDAENARQAQLKLQESNARNIALAGQKLRDPNTTPEAKQRWQKYYDNLKLDTQAQNQEVATDTEKYISDTNEKKMAAATASVGFDALTLPFAVGGSTAIKIAARKGMQEGSKRLINKQAVKEVAKQSGQTGVLTTPSGALDPVIQKGDEATAADIALGGAMGFGAGAMMPTGLLAGEQLIRQGAKGVRTVASKVPTPEKMTRSNPALLELEKSAQDMMSRRQKMIDGGMSQNSSAVKGLDNGVKALGEQYNTTYKTLYAENKQKFLDPLEKGSKIVKRFIPAASIEKVDPPRNQVDDMLDDAITPKPKTVKVNSDLERLQQRRAEFQKNPAEVEARVQAETPEVPQRLTREDIQARLTEMQVDPRNFNNVSMSSLQNIFEDTDFSKIKNPGGFIRSELDRLAQSNADNPSITAMRNNVTQQRLADDVPQTVQTPVTKIDPETNQRYTAFEQKPLRELTKPFIREQPRAGDYDTAVNGVAGRVINGKFHAKPEFNKEYPTYGQKELVQPKVPIEPQISTPQPTNLGTMVQDFYDNKAGNQKISFRDVEDLGIRVAQKADDEFKNIGSNLSDVMARVEKANRDGVRNVDEVLTPQEASIWRSLETELDTVRRRGSLGKKEIGEGDFGETYVPNEKVDQYPTRESLFEGFRATKPGNENVRTGAIDYDKLNFSPEVISGYVTRYADTKLLREERAFRAMQKNNPDLPEEQLRSATNKLIAVQDDVNAQKTKISLGGLGKKKTVVNGKKIDFAGEMSQIGKDIGKPQVVVDGTPRGLTNGDRVNSVMIDDNGQSVPIGKYLALNQVRDSGAYAGTHVAQAGGDRQALANLVRQRLEKDYRLPADDVNYLVESVSRIKPGLDDRLVTAQVTGVYRNAAKQQMIERLQGIDIQNKTLKNDVSELANQIVREGTIEQELSAKLVQGVMRAQNALFRKLNVSSALNELSDIPGFYTVYGRKTKLLAPDFDAVKRYGLGEIDPALEPYIRSAQEGVESKNILSKINDATRLYKYVETYKAATLLPTIEKYYADRGLTGDALTERVLQGYRELALPVDAFTKTFLNDYPLWTQYMSWGARNLQKEGRLLTGQIDQGVMQDKTQAQRIARDLYANVPAKTAFWLASNGLKGTGIMTAFGLTDFTGLTSQDYSGIAEEDKSWYDKTTQWTNMSTTLSLLNTLYQTYEKEQLAQSEKYKGADYNPYENANLGETVVNTYTPQFIKNALGANDLRERGYSDTQNSVIDQAKRFMKMDVDDSESRVQYEKPDGVLDNIKAIAFGKNQTANAREYSGRKNIVERLQGGQNPLDAVKDMALEQVGFKDPDYNRPLTDDYSKKFKEVDAEARKALLQGGRAYNGFFDDLKKNNPDQYNDYVKSMDGNHVSPEYWNTNSNGGKDLTNFKMMRDRKIQLKKDLGTPYDPLFDLPDDQARSVLAYQSAATGTDLALRNMLNKEDWYKEYKKKRGTYFDSLPPAEPGKFDSTERVKQWNGLEDQLNSFYYDKDATEVPAWAEKFPAVYEQKRINAIYGFGSAESDAFFKGNADQYQSEKEAFDKTQLNIINEMRKIEGVSPMSWEEYQQATEIADTEDSDGNGVVDSKEKSKFGKSGGGSGNSSGISPDAGGSYSHTGASKAAAVNKVKAKVVKIKPRTELKKITVKRSKSV